MEHKGVKRLSTNEVKTHFGRIVHEVATTGTPVIVQTRGEDQAVIVSLRDFQTLCAVAQTPAGAPSPPLSCSDPAGPRGSHLQTT